MLLHGYVPGDLVSFTVDGDTVSVDFGTGVVESSPTDSKLTSTKGSAVYYSQMVCQIIYVLLRHHICGARSN